jgi:hypothetical protein
MSLSVAQAPLIRTAVELLRICCTTNCRTCRHLCICCGYVVDLLWICCTTCCTTTPQRIEKVEFELLCGPVKLKSTANEQVELELKASRRSSCLMDSLWTADTCSQCMQQSSTASVVFYGAPLQRRVSLCGAWLLIVRRYEREIAFVSTQSTEPQERRPSALHPLHEGIYIKHQGISYTSPS